MKYHFFDNNESQITKKFLRDGFIIFEILDKESLAYLKNKIIKIANTFSSKKILQLR